MNVIASGVMIVGKDVFQKKDGSGERYSLMMVNGTGQPLKLSCDKSVFDSVKPFDVRYDVEMNLDTVGYNIYGDILTLAEV